MADLDNMRIATSRPLTSAPRKIVPSTRDFDHISMSPEHTLYIAGMYCSRLPRIAIPRIGHFDFAPIHGSILYMYLLSFGLNTWDLSWI